MGQEAILENYFGTEVTAVREAPGLENVKRRPATYGNICFSSRELKLPESVGKGVYCL